MTCNSFKKLGDSTLSITWKLNLVGNISMQNEWLHTHMHSHTHTIYTVFSFY